MFAVLFGMPGIDKESLEEMLFLLLSPVDRIL
jgi:hypothetical protein